MSNPKRVWDSKKRAVRQGKEQVWLENGEKVVNTNHGFAEATGEDVVYDSSWEVAQEPLQTYENGWSEDVPSGSSIIINKDLSVTSGPEFTDLKIYFYAKNIANISVDISSPGFDLKGIEAETGEGYNYVATITVLAVDEATAVFTDSVTGDSDSIELKGEMPPIPPTPDPYVVNEHTIAYYPFEDDTDNYATEGTDLSLVDGGTFTKSTIGYAFSGPARSKFSLESNDIRYASVWFYCNDDNFDPTGNIVVNNYQLVGDIQANAHHGRADFDNKFVFWQGGNWSNPQSVSLGAEKQWHQVSWSYDDTTTTVAMYIDGQRVLLSQNGAYNYGDNYNAVQLLYAGHISYELVISDLILEDRPWTDEEVEAYYELSSSKYPEPEPTTYTVTITPNDIDYGTVSESSLTNVLDGTTISANGNVLTIGENTVTATAETGYEFSSWGTLPETVTEDLTITATFEATIIPVESISGLPTDVTGVAGSVYSYNFTYSPNDAGDVENQITIVSGNDSIATVNSTSVDNGYFYVNYSCVSEGTTTFTHYINGVSAGTTTVTIDALVPVQSISQPSSLSVTVQQGQTDTSITMDYLPTNANDFSSISFNVDDTTIAGVWANSISSGTMTLAIQGLSEGTTNVYTICGEDNYTIAVTVTAPL